MLWNHSTIATIAALEDLLRNDNSHSSSLQTLHFVFRLGMIGPQEENTEWQASITYRGAIWVEYGSTLQEASQRLLYMLHHPELYDNPEDD